MLSPTAYAFTKEQGGALIGGIAGGVVGSQFGEGSGKTAATIGGVLIGGFLGSQVGRSMDKQQRTRAEYASSDAFQNALHTGEITHWSSDNVSGKVVPGHFYSHYCRYYISYVYHHGHSYRENGRACENSNGYWRIR